MEYFSVGVTDDIINLLATIPDLRVTSRTSSFHFQNKDMDLPTIAQQLNVQTILEGSVRRQGDEILVTAQLIDVESDTQVDAIRITRPLGDLFDVQDEIAAAIANHLRVSLGRIHERSKPTENMRAHQLYLQARFESRKRTSESMNKAIELLDQAILIDPEFGAAYEELATTYMALPGYSQRPNDRVEISFPKAIVAAQRANELNPILSKPYAILAARSGIATDYVTARKGFERALALAPNDPELRIWYGMLLSAVGDLDYALEQFSWAHRVDPLSGLTNGWMGIGLWRLGRDEEAISYLDTSIALGYVNARFFRAQEHIDNAEFNAAHELLTVWARNQGIDTEWVRVYLSAIKNSDRRDEAIKWIRELEITHRDIGPLTYADIGALDEAFASAFPTLGSGGAFFFIGIMDRQPREFRRDRRFPDLVRKTGLIDYWNTHGWNGYCQQEGEQLRCD
jgi:TolB-like protein/Tfp pilus assembly protein PilF